LAIGLFRCALSLVSVGSLDLAFAGSARAQSPTAAPTSIAVGDWQIAPTLELRTRGEYRRDSPDLAGAGTVVPPVPAAAGILERARLGIGAEYGASRGDPGLLRAQLTLQDSRAWGTPAPTGILGAEGSSPSSTSLYEGWVEVRSSSARPAFLRLGRQAVTWGDGRLLSNADWSPVARTLDAARGHASAGIFDFELLAAILEAPTPLGAGLGQTTGPASSGSELYGAQLAASVAPLLKLELSLFARVRRSPQLVSGDGETYVSSLRVSGGPGGGWRYAVEGAFELQRPVWSSGATPAWAGAGYLEKTLDTVMLTPTFRLEASAATGASANGSHAQFDPLLPDVHQLHGAMDLFAWSNTAQGTARISVVPWAEGRVAAEYRYVRFLENGAWQDSYLADVARVAGSESAHEVDLWADWRPWAVLELGAGYSALVLSKEAQGALSEGTPQPSTVSPAHPPYTASVSHFAFLQATLRVP
jgi:hypothetical protein